MLVGMAREPENFQLPGKIERCLSVVSKMYASDGERELQELLVNSQTRVQTSWTTDNWDGGTFGHALFLVVPEALYLRIAKKRDALQKRIRDDLNSVHNVQGEFFAEVFLEIDPGEDSDWRKDSGLLLAGRGPVSNTTAKRIWGDAGYRLFLSHKSSVKKKTHELKAGLELLGICAFVAHEDIEPTKAWQNEIESALTSMDAFAALLTDDFHESEWTDQEVGFAFARNLPIIAVKLGRDPYGFIGKFQALPCTWETAAVEIVKVLLQQERMLNAYIQAVRRCPSWVDGLKLAEILPAIDSLKDEQARELVAIYNECGEVNGSFGFNGSKPLRHGEGLLYHLRRTNRRKFEERRGGGIKMS